MWWAIWIFSLGAVKGRFASILTGDCRFFFLPVYGALYVVGYIPAKLFALLTLYNNSWGTNARLFRNFTRYQNYLPPAVWMFFLFAGLLQNFLGFIPSLLSPTSSVVLVTAIVATIVVVYYMIYYFGFKKTGIFVNVYKRDYSYEELYSAVKSEEKSTNQLTNSRKRIQFTFSSHD
ncbi:hypothetical protein K7432_015626 [Basidiobolus ranarum]|uniref:Uncharacterized protein n=1 Tax=Basidiobolus ranarum TaxID=34480 RepID=A0ABR2WG13_9FUNG